MVPVPAADVDAAPDFLCRQVDQRWNRTARGAQGPAEQRIQEFDPIGGLVVGGFGEASAGVLTLIQRTALFNAERNGLWRCTGASSLEDGAKVLEKRAIRTLRVEGMRGLTHARLANLSHACSDYRQSGPNRGPVFTTVPVYRIAVVMLRSWYHIPRYLRRYLRGYLRYTKVYNLVALALVLPVQCDQVPRYLRKYLRTVPVLVPEGTVLVPTGSTTVPTVQVTGE